MARPERITVNNGDNSWESQLNTNLQQLYDRPIAILLHNGDLTSLQSTYPAAQYEWCMAIVDYDGAGTPGQHLAFSNGTAWKLASNWEFVHRRKIRSVSTATSVLDDDDTIVTTGASNISITLPAIADANEGRIIRVKHNGTGTITLTPAGGDTVDTGASAALNTQFDSIELVSDGTSNWLTSSGGGGGGGGASTFLGLTDSPGSYSGEGTKHVRVNSGATALEFVDEPNDNPIPIIIAASDETTALTTGTGKVTFRMPYGFTLTEVRASLTTASTTGTVTVDINEGGVSILSTKLTIDATEKTSETASTAAVISDSALADDAEITIDIDDAGSSADAAGLKVVLIGNKT